jgi:hypothetical protein
MDKRKGLEAMENKKEMEEDCTTNGIGFVSRERL